MKLILPAILSACTLLLTACDSRSTSASGSASAPAVWMLAEMPADAKGVTELKASAQEGDRVVLRGRVGGSRSPLSSGSPIFTLVDASIPTCADNPDDNCPTPWDYCCEPRQILTAGMATVQLVDAEGNPIVADPSTVISPMDTVVIVGTVAARPSPDVLTIRATGLFREEG